MARVCVVGAGVVGACAALRLAQAGADVTVLDAGSPAGGTSATSFAWAGASHHGLRDYLELHVDGLRAYRRVEPRARRAGVPARTGCLTWHSDPASAGALAEHLEDLGRRGYPATWLTPAAVTRDLEPDLRFAASVGEVAFLPDEAHVAPVPMVRDVLDAARAGGAVVRTGARVREIAVRGDAVAGVALAGGETIAADRVVVCAGRGIERARGHRGRPSAAARSRRAGIAGARSARRHRAASGARAAGPVRRRAHGAPGRRRAAHAAQRPARRRARRGPGTDPAPIAGAVLGELSVTSTAPRTRASRRPASAAAS